MKNEKWTGYALTLAAGLLLGVLLRGCIGCGNTTAPLADGDEDGDGSVWTCSMDPQVKQPQPGKCPICGMDLIKMKKGEILTRFATQI